jgi:hypothetical protein
MEPAAVANMTTAAVAWWQRPAVLVSAAVVLVTVAAGTATVFQRSAATAPASTSRFELPVDAKGVVWSPDGRQLAWIEQGGDDDSPERIFLRRLDEFQTRVLDVEEGREFFYLDGKRQWHSVTVRGARPDAPFELGRPLPLKVPADVPYLRDLTPDGKRFLAIRELPSAPPRLAIVQHFFEELRAKVPVR